MLRYPGVLRVRRRIRHVAGVTREGLQRVATALGAGGAALRARFAYRRREIAVLALLSASLLGGLGVEMWRNRAPTTLARLEAEPPRLAAAARSSAPRAGPTRREPCADRTRSPGRARSGSPDPAPTEPLDLNHATAIELTRLPGIGPRLAERIIARRDALGGRFRSPDDLATVPGLGRRKAEAVASLITVGTPAAVDEAPPGPPETPIALP